MEKESESGMQGWLRRVFRGLKGPRAAWATIDPRSTQHVVEASTLPRSEEPPDLPPPLPPEATDRYGRPLRGRGAGRGRVVGRLIQLVDFLFYVLYGLLALRLVLGLLNARPDAGFVRFIYRFTEPFYQPFAGIVPRPQLDGGFIDLPLIVALVAYIILNVVVHKLLRIFQR